MDSMEGGLDIYVTKVSKEEDEDKIMERFTAFHQEVVKQAQQHHLGESFLVATHLQLQKDVYERKVGDELNVVKEESLANAFHIYDDGSKIPVVAKNDTLHLNDIHRGTMAKLYIIREGAQNIPREGCSESRGLRLIVGLKD